MVKPPHEALHRIFRDDPHLLGRTFEHLFGDGPPAPIAVSSLDSDATEVAVIERRVGSVLWLEYPEENHVLVIEAQPAEDPKKQSSWPYYISHLHEKYACGVTLLVTCPSVDTACWARKPIVIGSRRHSSQVTTPLVLGPDNVEAVTSPKQAAEDALYCVFSALVHRKSAACSGILKALAPALDTIEIPAAQYFAEFTEVGLGDGAARKLWRKLMTDAPYKYASEMRRRSHAEGQAKMAANAVFTVLNRRDIPVSEGIRERISACRDEAVLSGLVDRAFEVRSADELLDGIDE